MSVSQSLESVPLDMQEAVRFAKKDPIWKKLPPEHSARASEGSKYAEYQSNLMKGASKLQKLYSKYYVDREGEGIILPWALDFKDMVCLPPSCYQFLTQLYQLESWEKFHSPAIDLVLHDCMGQTSLRLEECLN